jgi:hypothetical protein
MSELPDQTEVLSGVYAFTVQCRPELTTPVVDTKNTVPKPDARLARPGIQPYIKEYLEKLGAGAIDAYGSKRLFHATHSSNLPSIEAQGLSGNATIIESGDMAFLDFMFSRYGSKHPQDAWSFNHFVRGKRDESDRGVYLSAYKHEDVDQAANTLYGLPEKLCFFLQEMDYLSGNQIGSAKDQERAKEIFSKYYHRISNEKAAIVLLEVDRFAPEVINQLLEGIENLEGKPIISAAISLRNVREGPAGVNLYGPIMPENLAIAAAKPFDIDYWDSILRQNRSRFFGQQQSS